MTQTKLTAPAQNALKCVNQDGQLVPDVRWLLVPLVSIVELDGTEPEVEAVSSAEILELVDAGLMTAKFEPTDLGRRVADGR